MNILLPWSLGSYIPLNGFHPLYRSLAGLDGRDVRLLVPTRLSREQYTTLILEGLYRRRVMPPVPGWAVGAHADFDFRTYARGHSPAELMYSAGISADIELHHTAPVTVGTRPWALQFESFLPVFFPHFEQGGGFPADRVNQLRRFYAAMFESDSCVLVTSHIQSSLDQFSDFFQSTVIDRKLVHLKNGIDPVFAADPRPRAATPVDFLFINSAHQHPDSFVLRGGAACLELALNLLDDGLAVRFFFRTAAPTDATLTTCGIDPERVRHYRHRGIVWIDSYLTDGALSRLMADCHFLLLPSANLHSVAILSAMANGTVPVVTDTHGTDAYVTDEVDGLVLSGVREVVWRHDAEHRLMVDDHARYAAHLPALTQALITRIRGILSQPERIAALGDAARRRVAHAFDGRTFAARLIDLVRERADTGAGRFRPLPEEETPRAEEWTADLSAEHFDGPPRPLALVHTGGGVIYRLRNQYVFVPRFRSLASAPVEWSELQLAAERFAPPASQRLTVATTFADAVEAARLDGQTPSPIIGLVAERLDHGLKAHPQVLRGLRAAYRTLHRVGFPR